LIWRHALWSIGLAAGAIIVALVAHFLVFASLKRITRRRGSEFYDRLAGHEAGPTRLLLPLLALMTVIPWMPLDSVVVARLNHAVGLVFIACVA